MEEETWSRRIWEAGSILKNVYTKDTVLSVNTTLNNLTVIVQNKLTEHHCVPTSHFEVNIIAYSVSDQLRRLNVHKKPAKLVTL